MIFIRVACGCWVGPIKNKIVFFAVQDPTDAHIAKIEVAFAVGTRPSLCAFVEVKAFLSTFAASFEAPIRFRSVAKPLAVVLIIVRVFVFTSRLLAG